MLSNVDSKVLELMSSQLLMNSGEIVSKLEQAGVNCSELNMGKLIEMGYVEKVESLGACFVLTQSGQRAAKVK